MMVSMRHTEKNWIQNGNCKKRRFETETENQEFETETSALANLVGSSLFCGNAVIEL